MFIVLGVDINNGKMSIPPKLHANDNDAFSKITDQN